MTPLQSMEAPNSWCAKPPSFFPSINLASVATSFSGKFGAETPGTSVAQRHDSCRGAAGSLQDGWLLWPPRKLSLLPVQSDRSATPLVLHFSWFPPFPAARVTGWCNPKEP